MIPKCQSVCVWEMMIMKTSTEKYIFLTVIFHWKPHFFTVWFLSSGWLSQCRWTSCRMSACSSFASKAPSEEGRTWSYWAGLCCPSTATGRRFHSDPLKFWAVWATGSRSRAYEIKGFCVPPSLTLCVWVTLLFFFFYHLRFKPPWTRYMSLGRHLLFSLLRTGLLLSRVLLSSHTT